MIDFGLSGKCAVVSGAGYIPERAGHGRSCALKLAEAGATVAIERLTWAVAEDRITSPFGHSSSLSGLAGGRLSQAPGHSFTSKIWPLLSKPTSGRV